jgi:hypothetical protein
MSRTPDGRQRVIGREIIVDDDAAAQSLGEVAAFGRHPIRGQARGRGGMKPLALAGAAKAGFEEPAPALWIASPAAPGVAPAPHLPPLTVPLLVRVVIVPAFDTIAPPAPPREFPFSADAARRASWRRR